MLRASECLNPICRSKTLSVLFYMQNYSTINFAKFTYFYISSITEVILFLIVQATLSNDTKS